MGLSVKCFIQCTKYFGNLLLLLVLCACYATAVAVFCSKEKIEIKGMLNEVATLYVLAIIIQVIIITSV